MNKKPTAKEIMWGEIKVDIYTGPKCDQHKPYWNVYYEDDKEDDNSKDDLVLSIETLPPGTKVVVSVPICPKCDQEQETCNCGFDWKEWIEGEYG